MKCCDCCNYGPILSDEALNDRLYWVEILVGAHRGEKSAAWRDWADGPRPWLISAECSYPRLAYADDEIRIIHEIIPED